MEREHSIMAAHAGAMAQQAHQHQQVAELLRMEEETRARVAAATPVSRHNWTTCLAEQKEAFGSEMSPETVVILVMDNECRWGNISGV